MKYTLQDLQEEKVYIELTCDEDFDKLLPYISIVKCGKQKYPYFITLETEDGAGWTDTKDWFPNNNYQKIEVKDLFFDLDDLTENAFYIELKNKEEIKDWKEIILEKLPHIAENIFSSDKCFLSFYDDSWTMGNDDSYIKDGYKKVELEFINLFSKENCKTKILTFTIDGNSTYNLEIKWEDWELLKQGNKLKLL